MAEEAGPRPLTQALTSLYFCSLCKKPFSQETSCTRHVQYCRRRAAQQRKIRAKACGPCRAAKTKCDFKPTCSRCIDKRLACSYSNVEILVSSASRTESIIVSADDPLIYHHDNVAARKEQVSAHPEIECGPSTGNSEDIVPISLDDLTDINVFDDLNTTYPALGHGHQGPNPRKDFSLPHIFVDTPNKITDPVDSEPAPTSEPSPRLPAAQPSLLGDFPSASTVARPARAPGFLSHGCRQFLLSIIDSYPRMVAQGNTLPPFIHPYGCRLHFDGRPSEGHHSDISSITTPRLNPLGACINIARLHTSQPPSPSMNAFIWHTIATEHHHIAEQTPTLTLGETLSALQSTMLYGTIRVALTGGAYPETNAPLVRTMQRLAQRAAALAGTAFSARHARAVRPSWEEWICEETRRRISVVCFLLALTIPNPPGDPVANPHNHVLPAGKALWEARSREEWERLYVHGGGGDDGTPRLETVGDFIIARLGRVGRGGLVDDLVGRWYAEMDGLGMLLAALVASL